MIQAVGLSRQNQVMNQGFKRSEFYATHSVPVPPKVGSNPLPRHGWLWSQKIFLTLYTTL
jgi:hypothetical protein